MSGSGFVTSASLVVPLTGGSHKKGISDPIKLTDGSKMKARNERSESREGTGQRLQEFHHNRLLSCRKMGHVKWICTSGYLTWIHGPPNIGGVYDCCQPQDCTDCQVQDLVQVQQLVIGTDVEVCLYTPAAGYTTLASCLICNCTEHAGQGRNAKRMTTRPPNTHGQSLQNKSHFAL